MKNAKIKNLKNHVQIEKNGDFYMEMLSTLNRKSDAIFSNPPFSTDLADLDLRFSIKNFCYAKCKRSEICMLEDL